MTFYASNMIRKCQAMRVIINDKRYGALKTLGERKQVFNEVGIERLLVVFGNYS